VWVNLGVAKSEMDGPDLFAIEDGQRFRVYASAGSEDVRVPPGPVVFFTFWGEE